MQTLKKIRTLYNKLNLAFEKQFGWFFVNGRKADAVEDWVMS